MLQACLSQQPVSYLHLFGRGLLRWGEVIAHAMIESKEVDAPVAERTFLFRVPYYGL